MTIFIAILFFVVVLIANAPWMLAFGRGHQHRWAILLVQTFFGWTVFGWLVSLIWAATGKSQDSRSNWTCVQIWVFIYFLIALGLASVSSAVIPNLRSFADEKMKPTPAAIAASDTGTTTFSIEDYKANTERLREEAQAQEGAPNRASTVVEEDVTGQMKAPTPTMYPTSFDCNGSLTRDEYLICTNPDLAMEDQKLAITYEDLKASASPENRARIVQNAREQLIVRRACDTNTCVLDWYHDQEAWARMANAKMKGYL